jgi:His-Xaa-Ser system radical SAM maturase HxsB
MSIDGKVAVSSHDWRANFRARALSDRVVLVSDHGSWMFVSRQELAALHACRADAELLARLERRGLLRTPDNQQDLEQALERWRAPHLRGASLHIVVTTRRCNLACRYCHASSTPENGPLQDLDAPTAEKIVDFAFHSPVPSLAIEFQGGESLLNLDAVRHTVIVARERARQTGKKVRFSLVSNLTLLTPSTLDYLKENQIGLSTSVDGPPAIHDRNRPFCSGCGSYRQVMAAVQQVRQAGCHAGFLTVLTPASLPHYKEIVDHHLSLGIDILCLNPAQALGRGRDDSHISDFDAYLDCYRKILDYTFALLDEGVVVTERFLLLALQKVVDCSDVGFADFRNPCGAVFSQLAYDVNGDIYPCDEARSFPEFRLGNVALDTYEKIVHLQKARDLVRASIPSAPLCRDCAYEPYCGLCPVMSYAEGRGLTPVPPDDFRCRLTRFLFDFVFEKMASDPEQLNALMRYQALRGGLQKARAEMRG